MHNDQQFEQLMLQYNQLKNGAEDIYKMIEAEDYDGAITLMKSREPVMLNCKCMSKYLELSEQQQELVKNIKSELSELEKRNIEIMQDKLGLIKEELKQAQRNEKIQQAYDFDESNKGSIINLEE